jgi:hypothetical protein
MKTWNILMSVVCLGAPALMAAIAGDLLFAFGCGVPFAFVMATEFVERKK